MSEDTNGEVKPEEYASISTVSGVSYVIANKRFIIGISIVGIFAISALGLLAIALLMAQKGEYGAAADSGKWLISLMATATSGITGYYFGSHKEASTDAKV